MSCQRHVTDPAQRARACRACLPGGRVEAWVGALEGMRPSDREAFVSARKDADWRVRWAAVGAEARLRGVTERRLLADWIAATPPSADLDACLTAARAAVEAGRSSADFLKDAGAKGPEAAARVWARREAIRKALELELYAEDETVRGTALAHLSGFLGRRPARVVMDALASRPEAGDGITAGALKVVAERRRTSVGRLLLDEARPADEARVNRLFAVYSRELEALQPELSGPDPLQRRKAVQSLRVYGPLARREYEHALGDEDRWMRVFAARGLAEAEGLALRPAAVQRLETKDAAVARPWLEAMVHEKGCAAFFLGVARDAKLPAALRGEALTQLADCDEGTRERFTTLAPYLHDSQAPVRAGAVRVLGALPARRPEVSDATSRALEDSAPEVVAAALEVVGSQRQSTRGDDAAGLLGSEHPVVRAAAAKALENIGRAAHVKGLAVCLREDPVAAVRVAAAQALGRIGGPHAAAALSDAATRDSDSHVQHVSREGLKRLGFGL
ncbi:HEAT repeat domain-containing protein [Pyxidicoccus parkwayensis]|uniref:HEAT repeat domain-containing protein n=2 Tax=Pyxidicoccus parkwayensis TaxID=2813578 RepID=A0ABX7PBX6_9BACT|nr:HEAT repeat domain-containing protein [Pyxidicoccus parkwaysis]